MIFNRSFGQARPHRHSRQLRAVLLSATALAGGLVLTPASTTPALAQVVIDGADETVIGTGGGTQTSPWTVPGNGDLTVGNTGTGTLTVSAGGAVTSRQSIIGNQNGSIGTVTVTGAGSTWNSTEYIHLGQTGNAAGTLSISNGGKVNAASFEAAFGVTSSVNVTVTGTGSELKSSTFDFARNGNTTLTISDGGKVEATGSRLSLGEGGTGTATVTGAGSELIIGSDFISAGPPLAMAR
jgi:T5SS/PEP-CTERM-associated repeat protein